MSIAFRSGPAESGDSADTAVITLHGVLPGDGLACAWLMDGGTYDIISIVATGDQAPENLTMLATHGPNTNISNTKMGGAYRKQTAHTGTVTITVTANGSVGGSLAGWAAAVINHDTVDFYDAGTDTYAQGNNGTPQVTLTTSVPNCAIFGIMNNNGSGGASAGSGVSGTTIIAMTDRHWNDDGLRTLDAGAAGVKNFNAAISPAQWGFVVFALKPVATGPTITDVEDESFRVGETGVDITGTGFGSTQGTGFVKVCPTNSISDVNGINLTVTGWTSTVITVDIPGNLAAAFPRNTDAYLFVQNDAGASNASGYIVQITPPPAVLAFGARLIG